MVIHAETISWNRFYNFLMGNSVLVLAWATIYASQDRSVISSIVLSAICLVGGFSGIVWAQLGRRSRKYVEAYFCQAIDVEKNAKWGEGVSDTCKPFTRTKDIRDEASWFGTSTFVLKWIPLLFTALYLLLIIASWWLRPLSSGGA
jgi:hypothetical protein